MTNSHITYQLAISRITGFHDEAAAARLTNEVPHGHRPGLWQRLVRSLPVRRGRGRNPLPQAGAEVR
jgi:hypothetical protein